MTEMTIGARTYSRNGKLYVGMTRENIQTEITQMGLSESDRAAKKLMKAFDMADGLGNDGIKDGVISEKELEAYDKKIRNRKIITGVAIGVGVAVLGAIAYKQISKTDWFFNKQRNWMLGRDAEKAFNKVKPDNFKGKGISYLVDAEASATPAFKLKMGKTVGETLELNKEVGLELVRGKRGKLVYAVKNPWTGWENLPGWKNEYGTLPFEQLRKIYPGLDASKYFCVGGPGMIKAYGATMENGVAVIQKASNGVPDIAFQVNATAGKHGAKDLVNITHVMKDGSAIKFDELKKGWTMVRKGQFNPADPSNPLPVMQTVVGFNEAKDISTLEGGIHSKFTMIDAGGYPYGTLKKFLEQLKGSKIKVNPNDPNSVKLFELAKEYNKYSSDLTLDLSLKTSLMQYIEKQVKEIIIGATRI